MRNESCLNATIDFLGDSKTKGFYKNASEILTRIPSKYSSNYLQNFVPWNETTIQCENYKRIENALLCPDYNVHAIFENEKVKNLIERFQKQPVLVLVDAKNGSQFMNSTWLNQLSIIPGVYFVENSSPKSRIFSFIYHVLQGHVFEQSPYLVNDDTNTISFGDLSLTGPPTKVRLGYATVLQKGGKFQCSFSLQVHELEIESMTLTFFNYFLIVLFGVFVVFSTIFFFLTLICNGKYEEKKGKLGNSKRFFTTEGSIFLDFLLTMIKPINKNHVVHIGTQAYFFLRYYKTIVIISFLFSLTSIPLIILDIIVAVFDNFTTYDFSTISIASISLDHPYFSLFSLMHMGVSLSHIIIMIAFISLILYISQLVLPAEDESSRTLEISNIPKDLTDTNVLENKFESYFMKMEIGSVQIAYVLEDLDKLVKEREKEEEQLEKLISIKEYKEDKQKWYQICRYSKIDNKIEKQQEVVDKIYQQINEEKEKNLIGSGVGFITFTEKEYAKKCLDLAKKNWEVNEQKCDDEILKNFKFNFAPQPSAIIWENLKYSYSNIIIRTIIGYFIVVIAFSVVSLLIFSLESITKFKDMYQVPLSKFYLDSDEIIKLILGIVNLFVGLRGIFTLFAIIFTMITIIILGKCLKKHSMVSQLKSTARGILFFMFINSLIVPKIPFFINAFQVAFNAKAPFNTYDYLIQGFTGDVLQVILLIPFLIGALTRFFNILGIVIGYCFNGKVKRSEFDFTQPTALSIYNFIHILFFSSIIPIVSIFGFFYFLFDYLIMKAAIYYYFEKSDDNGSAFLTECVRNLIIFLILYPIVMTLLMMRLKFYYLIPYAIISLLLVTIFLIGYAVGHFSYFKHKTFMETSKEGDFLTINQTDSVRRYEHPLKDEYFKKNGSTRIDVLERDSEKEIPTISDN
eukprot:gene5750-9571_t